MREREHDDLLMLNEVLNPLALGKALRHQNRMGRAITVFSLGSLALVLTELYYQVAKLELDLTIPNLSELYVPGATVRDVLFGRMTYVALTFIVVIVVARLVLYVFNVKEARSSRLISAVMHSYVVLALISVAMIPIIVSTPMTHVSLAEIEIEGLKLENVRLVGILTNGTEVNVSAVVMRADALIARHNVAIEGSVRLDRWEVKLLNATFRTDGRIERLGDVNVTRLHWERIDVDEYRRYSFTPKIEGNPVSLALSSVAWPLFLAYVTISLKNLYGLSRKVALTCGLLTYLVLLIFGLV